MYSEIIVSVFIHFHYCRELYSLFLFYYDVLLLAQNLILCRVCTFAEANLERLSLIVLIIRQSAPVFECKFIVSARLEMNGWRNEPVV